MGGKSSAEDVKLEKTKNKTRLWIKFKFGLIGRRFSGFTNFPPIWALEAA